MLDRRGLAVPRPHFGFGFAGQHACEFHGVLCAIVPPAVVVWVDISGREFGHGGCCGFCVHGDRQVHADKGKVDIFEGAHFWRVFGIAGNVHLEALHIEDIAVVAALRVEVLAALGDVVGWDRFDADAEDLTTVAIGHGRGTTLLVGGEHG